jgi:CRP-like cAMP-binding protein
MCLRLTELAADYGTPTDDGVLIDVGLSQQDLADWSGQSRDNVVHSLRLLRERGVAENGRARIVVSDLAALDQLARGSRPDA